MRDIFDDIFNNRLDDPVEAARRHAKVRLRDRFYRDVDVVAVADGFSVRLDGRPVLSPGRNPVTAPRQNLAEQIAAEWRAQRERIDPANMPMTRLANSIIDGVAPAGDAIRNDIAGYLGSDLVCYRAEGPPGLVARQVRFWDPILAWAQEVRGARFVTVQGVTFAAQPDDALAAMTAMIPDRPWPLGALHVVTTTTGSALIALALAANRMTPDEAWTAAHVDEDWQMQQWGIDDIAAARRSARHREFSAAAAVLGASC